MRQRRVLADLDAGEARESEPSVRGVDQAARLVLCHPRLKRVVHRLVAGERHLAGQAHQLDFMCVLDHPAPGRDRRGARQRQRGRRRRDTVREDKFHRLFDTDAARRQAAVLQPLRDAFERAFVFLPGRDIGVLQRAERQLLARAIFLEAWRHDVR